MKDVTNDSKGGHLEEGCGQEHINVAEVASIETNLTTSCLEEEKIQDNVLEGNSSNSDKRIHFQLR